MSVAELVITFIAMALVVFVFIAIRIDIKKPIATLLLILISSAGITSFALGVMDVCDRNFVESYTEKKETFEILEQYGYKITSEEFLEVLKLNEKFVRKKEQFEKKQIHFIKSPYDGIELIELPKIGQE